MCSCVCGGLAEPIPTYMYIHILTYIKFFENFKNYYGNAGI